MSQNDSPLLHLLSPYVNRNFRGIAATFSSKLVAHSTGCTFSLMLLVSHACRWNSGGDGTKMGQIKNTVLVPCWMCFYQFSHKSNKNSSYHFEDSFNKYIKRSCHGRENLFLIHSNIRNIPVNFTFYVIHEQYKLWFFNYRPVLLLSLFSEISERLMYNHILNFINKHRIFNRIHFELCLKVIQPLCLWLFSLRI